MVPARCSSDSVQGSLLYDVTPLKAAHTGRWCERGQRTMVIKVEKL